MRRTSFLGALTVIAVGGVLAFAIQSTPRSLDLHAAGLIIMVAGIADLVIRFLLADSPLLGTQAADVAAVVEPLGEPVLDVFGNPISPAPSHMLQPPPIQVPSYGSPIQVPSSAEDGTELVAFVGPQDTQEIPPVAAPGHQPQPAEAAHAQAEAVARETAAYDGTVHDQVVRQAGDHGQPSSLTPVYALTGRPVRVGRRRRRRG
jgi:hypothetical protein